MPDETNAARQARFRQRREEMIRKLWERVRTLDAENARLRRDPLRNASASAAAAGQEEAPDPLRNASARAQIDEELRAAQEARRKAEQARREAYAERRRARDEADKAERARRRADAAAEEMLFSERRGHRLSNNMRRLANVLGMLGSEHDGEVVNAARQAEAIRRRLNRSWEELLAG